MYITQKELKVEIRVVNREIKAVAKELGGEIITGAKLIENLTEIVELQQKTINLLCEKLQIEPVGF